MAIGIDDMAFYAPKLYLDIRTLAEKREIPYEKLSKGLGLYKMAICDAHEDAATMAAEAIAELMERNQLDPRQIGRIYLGTESALDMAKPTGTYAVEMLAQRFGARFGKDCFRHCDVLDMTFACIGAVDALQNTLDWVNADRSRIGIVVASDVAKYELQSTGEYTQGAGAVAMLVKHDPRLLAIRPLFGVAMESVHDFFKPRRERFSETPVFDGQYSNLCYQNRMTEAMVDFRRRAVGACLFREDQFKALSESSLYRRFVKDKLERSQRASQDTGNLYTASIFLALMSSLECDALENSKLSGKRIGFVAYGSGSKSKVFEAVVQKDWAEIATRFGVFEKLKNRRAIDYDQYELLHTGAQIGPVFKEAQRWGLDRVGQEGVTLGARYYSAM